MTATAIADARQLYADAGLAFPPLPADLEAALEPRGEHVFGTVVGDPPIDAIDAWADRAANGEEFAFVGMAGHGVNSWATHFYLSRGPVALLAQVPAGGAYMDPAETAERVEGTWGFAAQLLGGVDAAVRAGRWPNGKRILIVQTSFGESRHATLDPGANEPNWRASPSALADAVLDVLLLNAGVATS